MNQQADESYTAISAEYLGGGRTDQQEEDEAAAKSINRLRVDCPHCGTYMKVRTSKTHHPLYRELYMHCTNEFHCGFRCKAKLSLDEVLFPSYRPKASIHMKVSAWLKRQVQLEDQGQMRLGIENKGKKESYR